MAGDQAHFRQLLNTLLSTDNDIRTQAEEAYGNIKIDTKVSYLLVSLQDATLGEDQRQLVAVLLRRLLSSDFLEFFPKLPVEAQGQLKEQVLFSLRMEQSQGMRRKVCDVVSEVARNLIDEDGNNQWPEFLEFLFQCANSPDPQLKESALRMFTSVPGVFGNLQEQYMHVIHQMLRVSLSQESDYAVRFQAVKAVGAFILLHEKEAAVQKQLSDLLPLVMEVVILSIEKCDDNALIKVLIDIGESSPKFLRPQVETIFEICMKVLGDADAEDSWRQICLEVLVTLCETAPAMVRKQAGRYIQALAPLVLEMMTNVDEDSAWGVHDDASDDDNDANNVAAESALDRLCCGLGGKTMLGLIVSALPSMLGSADWKQRHAALMAVSAAGEGCHKQMEALLDNIVTAVLEFLNDPHPRVRYAACNAVGQMSTDFSTNFERKFHEKVVPGLLMVLDDNDNPRVQAHAAAALVNFSEDCPKNILTQYLDTIMPKLEAVLNNKLTELVEKGTKLVLEQVVTTIASVADTVEKEFTPYYDRLMPCLKYIIQNANTEELKMLRGKTIECVSLIGLAVGEGKFMRDASEVMDLLLKTHTDSTELPEDDPQTSYLISAWARICKILGKQFAQYLPLVMGPVMRTAAMKPEVALLDNEDLETVESDVDWQFVNLGEQQNFGIRTAGLEDKASACDMLVCYARELKEAFAEYAEEVVRLMVPMLKFYFHDGVRTAAAESLPYLLECARVKGVHYIQGMWGYVLPELLRAIDTEPEQDVLMELLHSLAKCIENLGNGCLTPETTEEVLRIIDKLMNDHFDRAMQRHEKRKDEDYDEVVEEQLVDEDNEDVYCLSKVADVIHSLMLTHGADWYPSLDRILPHFVRLLGIDRQWSDRQWGICIFDDIIEFGGPACVKYANYFTEPLLNGITDSAPEVRQAAAYGCGVLAHQGGDQFAATCAQALPRLIQIINEPGSRSVERISATENAISAVTKILKYNNSQVNVDEIISLWLSWLPVVEDADEAPHVYGYLCDLVEAGHPSVSPPAVLARVAAHAAAAFHSEALEPTCEAGQRLCAIVRQMHASPDLCRACITPLNEEQKRALQKALGAVPAS